MIETDPDLRAEAADWVAEAHDRLLRLGWHRGTLRDSDNSRCLLGAFLPDGLAQLSCESPHYETLLRDPRLDVVRDAHVAVTGQVETPSQHDTPTHVMFRWNDLGDRTYDEVLDHLRLMEKELRS